ncbi:hypothetical protein [Streptomyces sp. cg2]|uniref:hypothetical protein n=1 Tax=Streptomyces sp. cg2 TaxID=3238799 RepID=UPI0034E2D86F
MSALRTRRRNALRAAAASAAVAAVVLGPASAAFAESSAPDAAQQTALNAPQPQREGKQSEGGTEKKDSAKGVSGQGKDQDDSQGRVKADGAQDGRSGDRKKSEDQAKDDTKPKDARSKGEEPKDAKGEKPEGEYVRTVKLIDGSIAKVYKTGRSVYRADIYADGFKIGEVKAVDGTGSGEHNGLYIVLNQRGEVTSFVPADRTAGPGTCTVSKTVHVGAGLNAILTNSSKGLQVYYKSVDDTGAGDPEVVLDLVLDSKHLELPHSAGYFAKISGAGTASPKLLYKTQGGDAPVVSVDFPKLPKGCAIAPAGAKRISDNVKPAGGATNAGAIKVSGGQTKVVPQGGVAAGAENVAAADNTTLVASGGALAMLSAAGLGYALLRRGRTEGSRI